MDLKKIRQQRSLSPQDDYECQEGNPLGSSYSGRVNVTASGMTCQVWSALQPHEHSHTDMGKHNHCRNPDGYHGGVWCFTNDPYKRWELCSVPICASAMMKVLDFSVDYDHEPDSNGEFTSATLDAGALPELFTICSAIMVEAWTTEYTAAEMFILLDPSGDKWGYTNLFAANSYTHYEVSLGPLFFFNTTEAVFFPLQWSRACLSLDSGKVILVVDGELLVEEEYKREEDKYRPPNL